MKLPIFLAAVALLLLFPLLTGAGEEPPRGPFGLSLVATGSGSKADIGDFYVSSDCALCHPRQWKELNGSMHSVAHLDPFYRRFAELAREEAGDEVYAYCSGCHSAAGVVSGLIPGTHDPDLPAEAKAGVTCDVCHQISALTGAGGPFHEPGNASFVLSPGRRKFGSLENIARNPAHTGEKKDFYSTSEYCASCHTIIHPGNGLRIEHTYDEWKGSVYAEKGIGCQDCHMRTVEDARKVARTLEPVPVRGRAAVKGEERSIAPHFFVGGNANADVLAGSEAHAAMAEARLKSAAEFAVTAPAAAKPGEEVSLEIAVTNVGAGHNLPTSLTELRRIWVRLVVTDAKGATLFTSGVLDDHGEIPKDAIRFGAETLDADGKVTFRPWEAVSFGFRRLIPPKATARDTLTFRVPATAAWPLAVRAELLYRSAPPHVVEEVMGDDAFEPKVVPMAEAAATIALP